MPISQQAAHHRARIANAVLRGDDQAADEARRDLRGQTLEDHVRRVVEAAPPLSADQLDRIARILVPIGRAE